MKIHALEEQLTTVNRQYFLLQNKQHKYKKCVDAMKQKHEDEKTQLLDEIKQHKSEIQEQKQHLAMHNLELAEYHHESNLLYATQQQQHAHLLQLQNEITSQQQQHKTDIAHLQNEISTQQQKHNNDMKHVTHTYYQSIQKFEQEKMEMKRKMEDQDKELKHMKQKMEDQDKEMDVLVGDHENEMQQFMNTRAKEMNKM